MAQFVQHGSADSRHTVSLKFHAALQIEGVNGIHQAKNPGAYQIVQFDALGQPGPDPLGVVFHQMEVTLDQMIAKIQCWTFTVIAPKLLDIHVNVCHHGLLPACKQVVIGGKNTPVSLSAARPHARLPRSTGLLSPTVLPHR
jgi:hypothetical protein